MSRLKQHLVETCWSFFYRPCLQQWEHNTGIWQSATVLLDIARQQHCDCMITLGFVFNFFGVIQSWVESSKETTCHMGSHLVKVRSPPLPPAEAVLNLGTTEGCRLSWHVSRESGPAGNWTRTCQSQVQRPTAAPPRNIVTVSDPTQRVVERQF